jgi:large subunit ribosomal protein L29
MKIQELRELTSQELRSRGRDLKHEGLNLRIQKATGQLEDKLRTKELRRENARIETILTERRKGITVVSKPAKGKKPAKAKKEKAEAPAAEKKEKAPAKKAAKKAAKASKKDSE